MGPGELAICCAICCSVSLFEMFEPGSFLPQFLPDRDTKYIGKYIYIYIYRQTRFLHRGVKYRVKSVPARMSITIQCICTKVVIRTQVPHIPVVLSHSTVRQGFRYLCLDHYFGTCMVSLTQNSTVDIKCQQTAPSGVKCHQAGKIVRLSKT